MSGFKTDDGLEMDKLTDAFNRYPMDECTEHTAQKYEITRQNQDEYIISSYQRARQVCKAGISDNEITTVEVSEERNKPSKVIEEVKNRFKLHEYSYCAYAIIFIMCYVIHD